jgi:hypothetical protein
MHKPPTWTLPCEMSISLKSYAFKILDSQFAGALMFVSQFMCHIHFRPFHLLYKIFQDNDGAYGPLEFMPGGMDCEDEQDSMS